CFETRLGFRIIHCEIHQDADPTLSIRLLRARGERPRCRAAEKRDELAPPHSMTWSARATTVGGTVRPSGLAGLRLAKNSKRVGSSKGRSASRAPSRATRTRA